MTETEARELFDDWDGWDDASKQFALAISHCHFPGCGEMAKLKWAVADGEPFALCPAHREVVMNDPQWVAYPHAETPTHGSA